MHLYVHVPFCVRRCSYCDFSIAVRKRIPSQEYVDAVLKEASGVASPTEFDTIYLGGGTPSLLGADAIAALLHDLALKFRNPQSAIRNRLNPKSIIRNRSNPQSAIRDAVEVTLEANPEDVTPDHARAWRAAGVNRVSLGAQSFDDGVLKWMHRSHDAARIGAAVHALRGAGIDNISLDLIFGLPEELGRDWAHDLDMLCSLLPAHCSLYGLTVEPRTPLDRWISRGAVRVPDESRYADEYLQAHARLSKAGFEFYEVSNAARVGYRSRHNSAYWSGRPYLGLGPAAHSFDGRARRWNLSAWDAYRRAIAEGRSPVESEEVLTDEQRELEGIYLALRTQEGLAKNAVPRLSTQFHAFVRAGWLVDDGNRIRCAPEGWLRLDSLVRELAMQAEIRS